MKKDDRVVPKKNYLYLLIMIILVVIITFSIFNINKKYQERKLETSYFEGYINEISTNELNNILTEPSSELFILLTKTNDEKIYNFEIELKKVIKKRDIRDNFIYLDYRETNELDELNKILKTDIKTIPAIIYLKNGEVVKYIDSNKELIKAENLEQLLDEYEVE